MSHRIGTILVAVALLLAGCSSGPGGGPQTPTDTETAEQSSESVNGTLAANGSVSTDVSGNVSISVIPAVEGGEITDPDRLGDITRRVLLNTSNEYTYRNYQQGPRSGTNHKSGRQRGEPTAKQGYVDIDTETGTTERYADNRTVYVRQVTNGTVSTRARTTDFDFESITTTAPGRHALTPILDRGTYTDAGTVVRDGRALRKFTLASPDLGPVRRSSVESYTNTSGYVLVSESGVVHDAHLHLEGEANGGGTFAFDYAFTITQLGNVSVERPAWVDERR